jgi:type I restriction-modification system DNA methylase subunit
MAELDHLDLSIAPAHILGEAFQALIGPRLRGDKGQFFTPKSLVRAMVRIVAPPATRVGSRPRLWHRWFHRRNPCVPA